MNRIIFEYLIDEIKDDNDFKLINNNIEKYLMEEKKFLEDNNIKIINIDIENFQIEIDPLNEDKIKENLFKKIPFKIYNFNEILTSKRIDNNCKNLDLRTNIILSYFKEKNIHYGTIKDNKIIFSCFYPICNKTNLKCFIFKNSFHCMSMSKTDCCNEKHYKFYKEVKEELKWRYHQAIDLDKQFIQWDIRYVIVKFKNEEGNIIQCTLEKYFDTFKDYLEKPKFESKVILCKENIEKLLKHYYIEIKFNVITKCFDVFQFNKLSEYNLNYWIIEIKNKFDLKLLRITKEKVQDTITNIGIKNKYNPVKDYIEKKYNTFNEINDNEFIKLCDCIETDSSYKTLKLKRFLLQSINLILRDEFKNLNLKAEYILLLQGLQGVGKSTFVKSLLPENFKNLCLEAGTVDLTQKDNIIQFSSKWLIELGEVGSTFKKSSRDQFKYHITAPYDFIRIPYDKEAQKLVRRYCMIATTNDNDYLQDPTGSRRFLCLNNVKIDLEKLKKININNIWTYIYSLYLQKTPFYFSNDELKIIQSENERFTYKSDKQLLLEEYFNLHSDNSPGYKITECFEYFKKYATIDSFEIMSRNQLSKYFKKYNTSFTYDRHLKINLWNVDFLKEEINNLKNENNRHYKNIML